jgi:manganese/iron transport system substrate-binding protein
MIWPCLSRTLGIAGIALLVSELLIACAVPIQPSTSVPPARAPSSGQQVAQVVVSHSVLCDLTQEIAGDTIQLTCLIQPGTDPHVYQPTPQDRRAIAKAGLILYGGYNFEPTLVKLINASSNPAPKIAVDELAIPRPSLFFDPESGRKVPDPHGFHSAAHGARMAAVIADQLQQLQPQNAQLYAQNSQKLTTHLTQLHAWIKAQIATIPAPARKLVTTHDAFGYYADAYGIPVAGALQGIGTQEQPTAARVAELSQLLQKSGVPTIFAESSINPKLIQTLAKEAQVKVSSQELFADGLGAADTPAHTYPQLLIHNTQAIVQGLGGNYRPFKPQ